MLRELDKYLFRKMVVDRSDSEIEEELANGTFTISYLLNGEEIGIALRKSEGGKLVKRWQVLSKTSFGNQVTSGLPLEVWQEEQQKEESKKNPNFSYCVEHQMRDCLACY